MTHYRTLLNPTDFIGPQDVEQPRKLTISSIAREEVKAGEAEKAPMMYFEKAPKKFKVPKSVMYALNLHFGSDVEQWIGKEITLYKAQCMSFGETEECVRIQLPDEIHTKVKKWLKKRGASPSAYLISQTQGN